MMYMIDITGKKFGRLTVDSISYQEKETYWNCTCSCGNQITIREDSLASGDTKSCGCLRRDIGDRSLTHSEARHGQRTPEYRAWESMKYRCLTPSCKAFNDYGGRGIRVCSRWLHSYENFLKDMGRKPRKEYSLDRINNDGNYTPSNTRWATSKEQANNRRCSFKLAA